MVHLRGELDPVAGAKVRKRFLLEAERLRRVDLHSPGGEKRSLNQRMADSLDTLTEHGSIYSKAESATPSGHDSGGTGAATNARSAVSEPDRGSSENRGGVSQTGDGGGVGSASVGVSQTGDGGGVGSASGGVSQTGDGGGVGSASVRVSQTGDGGGVGSASVRVSQTGDGGGVGSASGGVSQTGDGGGVGSASGGVSQTGDGGGVGSASVRVSQTGDGGGVNSPESARLSLTSGGDDSSRTIGGRKCGCGARRRLISPSCSISARTAPTRSRRSPVAV